MKPKIFNVLLFIKDQFVNRKLVYEQTILQVKYNIAMCERNIINVRDIRNERV